MAWKPNRGCWKGQFTNWNKSQRETRQNVSHRDLFTKNKRELLVRAADKYTEESMKWWKSKVLMWRLRRLFSLDNITVYEFMTFFMNYVNLRTEAVRRGRVKVWSCTKWKYSSEVQRPHNCSLVQYLYRTVVILWDFPPLTGVNGKVIPDESHRLNWCQTCFQSDSLTNYNSEKSSTEWANISHTPWLLHLICFAGGDAPEGFSLHVSHFGLLRKLWVDCLSGDWGLFRAVWWFQDSCVWQ